MRRLRYLRNWELANVLAIPAMIACIAYVGADPATHWTRRAVGVGAVSYVLLQGGVYWSLKRRCVITAAPMPVWFRPMFTVFRLTNPVVLIVAFAAILRSAAPEGAGLSSDPAWALVLLGFAALEHVNYFLWQLMHDTPTDMAFLRRHKRLRRPAIWRDLRRDR